MKRLLAGLLAATILVLGSLTWGFLANHNRTFPYQHLRAAALKTGLIKERTRQLSVRSRSPAVPAKALEAVPYLSSSPATDDVTGVTTYDRERAFAGFNLFDAPRQATTYLTDMRGRTVHQWNYESYFIRHTELLPDGEMLIAVTGEKLLKLDIRSRVVWSQDGLFHHDLWIHDGEIYALSRKAQTIPSFHPTCKALDDQAVILSMDGKIRESFSVLDIFLNSDFAYLLPVVSDIDFSCTDTSKPPRLLDPLHTNHIEVFDGQLADKSPLFRRGNLLLSLRNINSICIVDGETREILWLWGPSNLHFQHQPTLLPNGHLLIFNNGAEKSEILEFDPLSNQIVWRYKDDEFFSVNAGSLQRLPNGNTLITESRDGKVLEVNPAGDIVWEFANPDLDNRGERGAIWRMTRFTADQLPFLPADVDPAAP